MIQLIEEHTMAQRNTLAHFLHDAGLAVWFGGTLMGAVGVNGAAADVDDPRQRARVANAGWARWTPVNAVAIGAHLYGGQKLLRANKGRVATQQGVLANTNTKLALTGAALAATAYARVLGRKVLEAGDVPVAGGTEPTSATPPEVAKAQKQLQALQWAIPALTGGILASSALQEEQQRTTEVLRGSLKNLPTTVSRAASVAGASIGPAAVAAKNAIGPAAVAAKDAIGPTAVAAKDAVAPRAVAAKDAIGPTAVAARDAVTPRAIAAKDALAPYAREAGDRARLGYDKARESLAS